MKKPSLRFRQVFEHPTHFKVTKPLGNPLIIAKKGLSPSLQTRLRKFAQGGEVKGYADGGDVEEQPENDFTQSVQDVINADGTDADFLASASKMLGPAFGSASLAQGLQAPQADMSMPFVSRGEMAAAPTTPAVAMPAPAKLPAELSFAGFGEPKEQLELDESGLSKTAEQEQPEAPTEETPEEETPEPKPVEPTALQTQLAKIGLDEQSFAALPPLQRVAAMNLVRTSMAADAKAQADVVAAEGEVEALNDEVTAQREELDRVKQTAQEARDASKSILEEYDYLKNPKDYFSKLSTGEQIATAIGLMLGAFASGITKTPNAALAIYNSAVENDLAQQKQRSDSLHQRLVAAGHSVEAADNLVRAQMKLVGAAELGRRGAMAKLPQVKARIEMERAKLTGEALQTYAQVAKDERAAGIAAQKAPLEIKKLGAEAESAEISARAAKEKAPYELQKLIAESKTAALKPQEIRAAMARDAERLKLDREKAEQAREDRLEAAQTKAEEKEIASELDIGDNVLHLKAPTRGPMIRDNIASRQQGIMAAMKLEKLLSTEGMNVFNPTSDKRGEAIAELNTLVEIFPKIEGFQRAISVSAKDQLKLALQDPTSMGAALKQIFYGRDPAVGVRAVLDEGKRSYADQVRMHTRESPEKREAAIQSFFKKAEQEIEKYGKSSLPTEALFGD